MKTKRMIIAALLCCLCFSLAGAVGFASEESRIAVQFSNCDAQGTGTDRGWYGGPINTADYKEGTGSFWTWLDGATVGNLGMPYYLLPETSKTEGLTRENGRIRFWMKVNQPDYITDISCLEITSSGGPDVEEFSWPFSEIKKQLTANTWCEVTLNFSDAQVNGGDPDCSAFDYMRILFERKDASFVVDIRIDDVWLEERETVDPPQPQEPTTSLVLNDCEEDSGWQGAVFSEDRQAGDHAVNFWTSSSLAPYAVFPAISGKDLTEENARIGFWIKAEDLALVDPENSFLGTSSSGDCDVEYKWMFSSFWSDLSSGWNWVELEFSDAEKVGTVDINALNYLRFYVTAQGGEARIWADQFVISRKDVVPAAGASYLFDSCDSADGWYDVSLDTSEKKEGTASLAASTGSSSRLVVAGVTFDSAANFPGIGIQNGLFGFWFWINDPENIKGSNFILASGDNRDEASFKWNGSDFCLEPGWNYVVLDFSKAAQTNPEFDPASIRLFQWVSVAPAGTSVKFDEMKIFDGSQGVPEQTGRYTVRFEANGGSGTMSPESGFKGERILSSVGFTKEGFVFRGWSLTPDGEPLSTVGFTDEVIAAADQEGQITLYAIWAEPVEAVQILNCDVNWMNSYLDTEDKKRGSASVWSRNASLVDMYYQFTLDTFGFTEENTSFYLWFWVGRTSILQGEDAMSGWIELGSTSAMDVDSYRWYISSFKGELQDGWNRVKLRLSEAIKTGSPDINHLRSVRVLVASSAEQTIKVDDLILLNRDYLDSDEEVSYCKVVYDGNGAAQENRAADELVVGSRINLDVKGYSKFGFLHRGWSLTPDGEPLSELNADSDLLKDGTLTLYAVWESIESDMDEDADGTWDTVWSGGCGSSVGAAGLWLGIAATAGGAICLKLRQRMGKKEDKNS